MPWLGILSKGGDMEVKNNGNGRDRFCARDGDSWNVLTTVVEPTGVPENKPFFAKMCSCLSVV